MIVSFKHYLEKQRMSDKTIYEYTRTIERFLTWYELTNEVSFEFTRLDQSDLEAYVTYLLHSAKLSASYVNKNQAALRKWLFMLQTQGLWPHPIDLPDIKIQKQVSPKSLEPHEVRAILYSIEQEKNDMLRSRDRCMIYLELYRGLRNEDLMLLDTEDVILKPGRECIIVRKGKGNKYAEIDIRSSRRIVNAIHSWVEERAKSKFAVSPRFFVTQQSGKITWGAFDKMVKRLSKRSGVEFTMHQLRHTFAHDLLKITDNIRLVQELLRHSDVRTTEIYTKQRPDEIQDALRKLDHLY